MIASFSVFRWYLDQKSCALPRRALDLHGSTDTTYPFTDRAQAHAMLCVDNKSAPIVRYGKLHRVRIIRQRHIHPSGVTMPRHVGKRFLSNAIKSLLHVQWKTLHIACDQLNVGIVAILPFEYMLTQGGDESLLLQRDRIDFLHEEG